MGGGVVKQEGRQQLHSVRPVGTPSSFPKYISAQGPSMDPHCPYDLSLAHVLPSLEIWPSLGFPISTATPDSPFSYPSSTRRPSSALHLAVLQSEAHILLLARGLSRPLWATAAPLSKLCTSLMVPLLDG